MKEQTFEIHLADEIPRIGAGRRFVHVKIGYKWVYVRTLYKKARVSRKKWNTIKIIQEIKDGAD